VVASSVLTERPKAAPRLESASRCTCDSDAAFLRSARPPYEALRPRLSIVDLFAGCGGLTLGAAEAARSLGLGIEVKLAVDLDPDAAVMYQANFPEADVRLRAVEDIFNGAHGSELTPIERRTRDELGAVDILVGGPPCQGHSDLNNHTRRADPRNALYGRMARAAEVLLPTLVLIENVPTVTHDVEKVVEVTIRALRRAGFDADEAVIDISQLGAAQRRRRHVVIASRDGRVSPAQLLSSVGVRCPLHPQRSVAWAIRDLLKVKFDGVFDSASTPNADNAERIAWLFEHGKYDLPNPLRPECHHSDHSYTSMYGRLHWDKPAQTVTTGFGSMGQGRYVHPARRRTITPHEAARLQMLPDFWDFSSVRKRGSIANLVGNAVPPILATVLLESALRSLELAPMGGWAPSSHWVERRQLSSAPARNPRVRRAGVPPASSPGARRRMEATRQKDTAAEMALRAAVNTLGLGYRTEVHLPGSRRRADLVFDEAGVVAFVDGCFWHACPKHRTSPKAHSDWWERKLGDNQRRDRDTDQRLRNLGWVVLRFWEHEDPGAAARSIATVHSDRVAVRSGEVDDSPISP
jgi:DNA (cytosine-5)-methyltransferase 1